MDLELRTRIWNSLVTCKYKAYYIERVIDRSHTWNRVMVSFLTITSISSVASWAIWKEYPSLWITIIAVSQIISALQSVFPFVSRIRYLIGLRLQLSEVEIEFEQLYSDINRYKYSDDDISESFFQLQRKLIGITQPSEKEFVFKRKSIKKWAQAATDTYLNRNYSLNS